MKTPALYRPHNPAYITQYAQLRERTLTCGALLPGTPGALHKRSGTGYGYWYRVYYPVPGKQTETLVGRADDPAAESAMRARMDDAESTARQISILRKFGFQVADKAVSRLLVELHNLGAFEAGLVLGGTLASMAWLNELACTTVGRQNPAESTLPIQLLVPDAFSASAPASRLPLAAGAGRKTSVATLIGIPGLPVEMLSPAAHDSTDKPDSEPAWVTQQLGHIEYLLDTPQTGVLLAGGHCIPVRLPQAARHVWHSLHATCLPGDDPEQAATAQKRALAIAAVLIDQSPWDLLTAWESAPANIAEQLYPQRENLLLAASAHPELQELLADCLRSGS